MFNFTLPVCFVRSFLMQTTIGAVLLSVFLTNFSDQLVAQEANAKQPTQTAQDAKQEPETKENWIDLFNGKNLDGWTVKIAGHPIGDNYADTFRVEDGILKCEYDDYKDFGKRYGHLYSNLAYSHYKLKLEYRFVCLLYTSDAADE